MNEPGQPRDPRYRDRRSDDVRAGDNPDDPRGRRRAFGSDIRRAQVQAELDASAKARELGHDPHPWARTSTTSRTGCRRCGAGGSITLHAAATAANADAGGETREAAPDPAGVDVVTEGRLITERCRIAP